jgi:hypothetical protein
LVITNFNGISNFTGVQSCTPIVGYVTVGGDCNDNLSGTNPGASEICNTSDDDCDGSVDEGAGSIYYADADGDGYGAMSGMTTQGNSTVVFTSTGLIINGSNEQIGGMNVQGEAQFVVPADGVYTFDWSYSTNDVDGANMDPAYYINGVPVLLTDNFGADLQSGSVSVNVTAGSTFGFEIIALDNVLGEATLVITNFNGLSNFTGVQSCTPIAGYVTVGGDCNDNLSGINPGASEICNTSDDDCDGSVDDGIILTTYYQDMDMDGYGGTNSVQACTAPNPMYVTQGGDCEDFNPTVNPGATEVCNSIDDDCDTQIDEGVLVSFYTDADGDGYGTGIATIACTAPVGMVANNTDCNDNSSAVNPGASETCNLIDDDCDGTADDGIAINTYYNDVDGDGFGAGLGTATCSVLSAPYVTNNTDCDDNNIAINPGAVEICLNAIDDDCDGVVNDGCLPDQLLGESPATAQYVWTNFFPSCVTQSHTLAGSSPSSASQSICLTGEDKWHYFTATSEAVSIVVASSANNILLELQSNTGVLLATENAVSGLGGEILNFSGLTAGQIYKVGVRNYNSDLGIGAYTICVKMLKRGGCDYGPGPYTLCQYFKATYAGTGAVYTFTFTGTSGSATGNVYTRSQSSDICILSNVSPSLPYGSTYSVLITSTYTLLDGAGNQEVIAVPGLSPCTMSTVTQPATSLRTSDQCANGTRFRGSVVASLPWVCGVTNWRWEFTEVNPLTYATVGLPIALNRGAASNYLNLGTVAALQNGKTYAVRTAPILASTGSDYQWGTIKYMCIIGSAGMVVEDNNTPAADTKSEIANEVNMNVYPNPTHGTDVNINLSGVTSENVQIRVVDAMGRQVWSNRYSVDGVLNTNITFEQPLANGLYFVEAIFNVEVQTQRLMVQK